jgi:hypothetical protein
MGRGECCAWPSTPNYVLFVTIIDGKQMSRCGCAPKVSAIVSIFWPYEGGRFSIAGLAARNLGVENPKHHGLSVAVDV